MFLTIRMTMKFSLWLLIAAASLLLGSGRASAHPHVWIVAKSELVYAPDGTITGVRHAWTFDDMFSTYAVQGIEQKTKGTFTRDELASLAKTNVESLKDYDFFTFAKTGAKGSEKKEKFNEPSDYYLEYKDSALVLHFMLPFKAPVKASEVAIEVFDPAYFIDFKFDEKDAVKLVGAPANCKLMMQRPTDGTAQSQMLSEKNFMSGDNSNYGAMFANKIAVDCTR